MMQNKKPKISGYGYGDVGETISAEEVGREAALLAERRPSAEELESLADGDYLRVEKLRAGYGKIEILHDFDLRLGRGKSLCLIGPNGAGKSTVLHTLYGIARRMDGAMILDGDDLALLAPADKLRRAKIAYVMQDNSVFPDMTVEENLLLGGYSLKNNDDARAAAERIFAKYPRLQARRKNNASALSGGERRLLEISRALITEPQLLLVDEPSIGLEPKFIDMVFEILEDLQKNEGRTILMVEQNAKKGLAFADIGYVLAAGRLVMAGRGNDLLQNPEVGRLFLGAS